MMRRWIIAIILLALLIRIVAVFALKRWDDPAPGANKQLAASFVEHRAFYFRDWAYFGPSSVATPPYPLLLAGFFALFGVESPTAYFAALMLNAVLGAVTAGGAVVLVRRMTAQFAPERAVRLAAIVAGLALALWPPQIVAALYVQPIVLTAFLLVIACALWLRALDRPGLPTWILFSLTAAMSALVEPNLAPALAIAVVGVFFVRRWPIDLRVRNCAVLLAVAVFLLLPWVARNRAVHGQWLLTTTRWQSIWAGANENATGSDRLRLTPDRRAAVKLLAPTDDWSAEAVRPAMMQIDLLAPSARYALREQREIDRERQFRTWAGEHLSQRWPRWLAQLPLRVAKLWLIDWDHPMSRNPLAIVPRAALAVAALIGLVMIVRRRVGAAGAPTIAIASILLVAAVTVASAKQTALIEPLQIALACCGFVAWRCAGGRSQIGNSAAG